MLLTVDHLQFCFLSVWYAGGIVWRRLRRIRNLKSLRSLIFAIAILYPALQSSISYATAEISIPFVCYRQSLSSSPVWYKWRDSTYISLTAVQSPTVSVYVRSYLVSSSRSTLNVSRYLFLNPPLFDFFQPDIRYIDIKYRNSCYAC